MSNLFDSANYPTTEPSKLVIGDYWAWTREDLADDYAVASYSWSYSAILEASPATKITINATGSGTTYTVEVASATTATYTAGVYHWTGYITRTSDSERIALDKGTFELLENAATSSVDPRSHVKKTLDALEAMIEGKATRDQKSYSIGDRSLERMSPGELMMWYDKYKYFYAQELNAERIANGLSGANTIRIRL